MQPADHLQLALGGIGSLLLVLCLLGKLTHNQLRHGGLVFYNIRAARLGHAGHLLGHLKAAVMVDPGLRNDRYRHFKTPSAVASPLGEKLSAKQTDEGGLSTADRSRAVVADSALIRRFAPPSPAGEGFYCWFSSFLRIFSSSSSWPISIQLLSLMG